MFGLSAGTILIKKKRQNALVHPFCPLSFVKLFSYIGKLEVKSVVFVVADSCRTQLERLTLLLVSAFPGSTIYRHTDLFHVPHDVLSNKIDAVFLEAGTDNADGLNLMQRLRRQKPDLPVFFLSKTDELCKKAVDAGADGCFVLPGEEEKILDALRLAKKKENVS